MSREVINMARGRPAKCPYCGGSSINKGFRNTKTMGKRRVKLCKACHRKFTPKNQRPGEEDQERTNATNLESTEATESTAVTESREPDKPTSVPAAPLELDENSGIVSSPKEEWTS